MATELLVSYIFSGILVPILSFIGIIGNTLSLMVLSKKSMRSSTINWYLMALALSDIFVLISSNLTTAKDMLPYESGQQRYLVWQRHLITFDLFIIFHPFAILFQVTSIWLTVAFSLDRYLMICHPFQALHICTIRRSKILITIIFIAATIYNIPRFFENTIQKLSVKDMRRNISVTDIAALEEQEKHISKMFQNYTVLFYLVPTEFGDGTFFKVYYHLWSWLILVIAIPFSSIIYMNIHLILEVSKSLRRLKSLNQQRSSSSTSTNPDNYSDEESRKDTNVMLIGVIVIFFICQIPVSISHILYALGYHIYIYNEVGNFLIILNSAVNFISYYSFSKRFRTGFNSLFYNCFMRLEICNKRVRRNLNMTGNNMDNCINVDLLNPNKVCGINNLSNSYRGVSIELESSGRHPSDRHLNQRFKDKCVNFKSTC